MTGIRKQRGFSITELLVAMVVGLFLLGGLVMLMANSKKNYAQQDYSARLQENARFAMTFLSYDLRMAGFFGCSNTLQNDPDDIDGTLPSDYFDTTGVTNTSDPTEPEEVTIVYAEPPLDDQELLVQSLGGPDTTDGNDYANKYIVNTDTLPDDWTAGAASGTEVVIADCGGASFARIVGITDVGSNKQITLGTVSDTSASGKTPDQVQGFLGRFYDPAIEDTGPITIRKLVRHEYTINNSGASGIPVLMRDETPLDGNPAQELVEGVENMQLLYQALSGGAFQTDAPTGRLAAIQLGVLVRSVSSERLDVAGREFGSGEDITLDDGTYDVLDRSVDEGQLRGQRRVFANTLAVRNRPL